MSITPIITFKAGKCDVDQSAVPYKVKAQPQPGYIYLYSEDDLIHFCWRPRSAPLDQAELDLVMVPTDGHFVPYESKHREQASAKTNGRVFVLKFDSSSQRHMFWLQSKPQGRSGDPAWFSPRDKKLGDIVNRLLQGDEVNINAELRQIQNNTDDSRRDDDDETMEDVEGHGDPGDHHQGSTGGAGADATGGDIRSEGEEAREGGADGARAASSSAAAPGSAAEAVRNLLASLQGHPGLSPQQAEAAAGKVYPPLYDLLETSLTVPMVEGATEEYIDNLLSFLPPAVLVLAQQGTDGDTVPAEPSAASVAAAKEAMSLRQKRALLARVLRSPQFHQSLATLTAALRDGGLPMVADALGIKVENGGFVRGGSVPLGGGGAVEAFVEGVKKSVQEEKQ